MFATCCGLSILASLLRLVARAEALEYVEVVTHTTAQRLRDTSLHPVPVFLEVPLNILQSLVPLREVSDSPG